MASDVNQATALAARFISESELPKVVAHGIGAEVYERLAKRVETRTASRNDE